MSNPASNPESSRQAPSRRRFLKGGAALGAALAAWVGHPIAGRAQPAPDDPSKVLGGPYPALRRTLALRADRPGEVPPVEDGRSRQQLSRRWTKRWGSSHHRRSTTRSTAAVFPTSTRASTVS